MRCPRVSGEKPHLPVIHAGRIERAAKENDFDSANTLMDDLRALFESTRKELQELKY